MSNDYKKAIFLRREVKFFKHLRSQKIGDFNTSSNSLINMVRKTIHILLFWLPLRFVVLKIDRLSKKYMQEETTKYVGHVADSKVEIYESDWFKEKILLDFEGYKFWAPKEYDKVLTQYFGDYMKLPPEKERVNHSIEAYWKD
jgi:lipopolysaccharide cholinephosphotransferase